MVRFLFWGFLIALWTTVGGSAPTLAQAAPLNAQAQPVVNILYFYATDCPHCQVVKDEVLTPLAAQYGARVNVRMVEISTAANYELLIRAEDKFGVKSEERGIPTLVIGDKVFIGEDAIRTELPALVEKGVAQGGIAWPALPGLDATPVAPQPFTFKPLAGIPTGEACITQTVANCETSSPIWAAYFYQVGCQSCSRAKTDLDYLRSRYPQIIVEEFNIYENVALSEWLAERVGRKDILAPAIFIGDEALIGEVEINPQNLVRVADQYAATGAPKAWAAFDASAGQNEMVTRFASLGPLAVIFAGLIDGLNPCAFATIIFFVSYLTISGRKGREVLAVGAAFTLGVFLAYLVIGLGFYKVLDLLGGLLTTLGRWVYGLTALLCVGLAIFSFLDFLKARRGQIGEMSLNLPHALRLRINAVIRQGRQARTVAIGAFVTGVVISFLELACTGQIYLPTIIFVTSVPALRTRAIGYLLLYNVLFITPLVIVFVMAYYGTTSKDLTRFLQQRAATVKLGMTLLFAALAVWLGLALL